MLGSVKKSGLSVAWYIDLTLKSWQCNWVALESTVTFSQLPSMPNQEIIAYLPHEINSCTISPATLSNRQLLLHSWHSYFKVHYTQSSCEQRGPSDVVSMQSKIASKRNIKAHFVS
jgi:hypothetical protein